MCANRRQVCRFVNPDYTQPAPNSESEALHFSIKHISKDPHSLMLFIMRSMLRAGCTDPSAANYNPSATSDDGSCTFVFQDAGKEMELSGTLHDYVTSALRSLWGAASHPAPWLCGSWQEAPAKQDGTSYAPGP